MLEQAGSFATCVGMNPRENDVVARTENRSHQDCVKQFASKNGAKDTEYSVNTYDGKTSKCTHATGIKGLTTIELKQDFYLEK